MSSPSSTLLPIQFLNAGNLVTAGLQLYRRHFKSYFRLALLAGAWLYLPIVILVVAVFIGIFSSGELDSSDELSGASAALIGLLFLVGLPIWLSVCLAKYQAFSAAISRLAFQQLINSPETASEASRYTNSRMWGFWLIGFFVSLIFGAVAFGLYILLILAAVIFAVVIGGTGIGQGGTDPTNPAFIAGFIAVIGLGILVIVIPTLMFLFWLFARLLVAEVPYAIDREITPTGSLGRSWDLTDKSGWRIITALVILAVVLFPIQFFQQTISILVQSIGVIADADQTSGIFVIAVVIGYAVSLLVSLLVLPLWQATKAVLYYDLRSRREGMGLELEPQDLASENLDSQDLDPQALQPRNLQSPSNTLQVPPIMQLFRQVKLLTPESVELEFTLAGIGNRVLALLIDYSILLIGGLIFWIIFGIFSYQLLQYLESSNVDYSDIPIWLLAIGFLLSFIFTTGYFVGFEVLRQGQTPGKRWAKIRVIREDGRPVGLAQAVLRSLVQPIDYFLFIGAFLIFFGKREKRIGDWAGGTLVIQENRALKQAIELSDAAKQLAPELPQTTDLVQLQPRHFAVIAEYLQRRLFLETKSKTDLSLDLARQTRTLIKLETIPSGLTSDQFLEAVYLAYQKQFSS